MRAVGRRSSALLVIAHPDDECMFFGPALLALEESYSWHVLCLSTGDANGQGSVRVQELKRSCELLQIQLHRAVDDECLKDGMHTRWSPSRIAAHVAEAVEALQPSLVLTFDDLGVSGHPNHISVHYGVQQWHAVSSHPCQLFYLKTLPLLIKFLGPVLGPLLWLLSRCGLLSAAPLVSSVALVPSMQGVRLLQSAMQAHDSQLVWFRLVYIYMSVYMFFGILVQSRQKSR